MPEFASEAFTVILAPFFFAERTEATLTAVSGAVAATAVAVLNTGAVVSRMMSSVDAVDDVVPKRETYFT
jgi:hypothetical protein